MKDTMIGTMHGYVRASTAQQEDTLVAQQDTLLREYRHRYEPEGWRWGGVWVDPAVSGGMPLAQRPQGYQMLCVLNPGDAVIATSVDRVFRSVADLASQLERWKAQRVKLVILNMQIDESTAIGEYLLNNLAALGQLERRLTAERTRCVMSSRKERGLPTGGRYPPYGYRVVGKKGEKRFVACPEQRVLGQQIVAWFNAGWTQDQVYEHLLKLGTTNPNTGELLGRSTVWRYYVYELELQKKESALVGE